MKLLFLTVILCFFGCGAHLVPGIFPTPFDDSACAAACQNLRNLGCYEGTNLPDGTTCEVFCSNTMQKGHDLHPACLAKINTCADQDMCR